MVPDGQKVRTDGMEGRTDDAKTISLRLRRGIKIGVPLLTLKAPPIFIPETHP